VKKPSTTRRFLDVKKEKKSEGLLGFPTFLLFSGKNYERQKK
tara:strand:+ start:367 stop:492 length:126 start_codon:yes stop_codon:yes gene_type:complete